MGVSGLECRLACADKRLYLPAIAFFYDIYVNLRRRVFRRIYNFARRCRYKIRFIDKRIFNGSRVFSELNNLEQLVFVSTDLVRPLLVKFFYLG